MYNSRFVICIMISMMICISLYSPSSHFIIKFVFPHFVLLLFLHLCTINVLVFQDKWREIKIDIESHYENISHPSIFAFGLLWLYWRHLKSFFFLYFQYSFKGIKWQRVWVYVRDCLLWMTQHPKRYRI